MKRNASQAHRLKRAKGLFVLRPLPADTEHLSVTIARHTLTNYDRLRKRLKLDYTHLKKFRSFVNGRIVAALKARVSAKRERRARFERERSEAIRRSRIQASEHAKTKGADNGR